MRYPIIKRACSKIMSQLRKESNCWTNPKVSHHTWCLPNQTKILLVTTSLALKVPEPLTQISQWTANLWMISQVKKDWTWSKKTVQGAATSINHRSRASSRRSTTRCLWCSGHPRNTKRCIFPKRMKRLRWSLITATKTPEASTIQLYWILGLHQWWGNKVLRKHDNDEY